SAAGLLNNRDISAVLNRISFLPRAWLNRISGPDRAYGIQEMAAFYLSWLHTLPGPKLNPPTPQGLCGNIRHPSAWVKLAVASGLPGHAFRQSSEDDPAASWLIPRRSATSTIYVVGKEVIGSAHLVRQHRPACLRLSEAAGSPLLGIDFAPDSAGVW